MFRFVYCGPADIIGSPSHWRLKEQHFGAAGRYEIIAPGDQRFPLYVNSERQVSFDGTTPPYLRVWADWVGPPRRKTLFHIEQPGSAKGRWDIERLLSRLR